MTMQTLSANEICQVTGALTLGFGVGGLTFDTNAVIGSAQAAMNGFIDDKAQAAMNGAIDGMQSKADSMFAMVPALPSFTVPLLGLTIGLTISR